MILRIRATGALLYVEFPFPKNEGDKFIASTTPPSAAPRRSGCVVGETADGVRFISCTRGQRPGRQREFKTYRFSPSTHDVVELAKEAP